MRPRRQVQRQAARTTAAWTTGGRTTTAMRTLAVAVAAAALAGGCQAPPKPAPPPPPPARATPEQAGMTQQQFAAFDPKARVGRVDAVSAAQHLAVVAGIPLADVKAGDPISFTGPDHQPVANGTITELDDHSAQGYAFLIVDYQQAAGGSGRDPMQGDLAITIPTGK